MENTVNERINSILLKFNIRSVRQFANKIGVAATSLNDIIRNGAEPKFSTLEKILKAEPSISAEWLLRGEGEMLKGKNNLIDSTEDDNNKNESKIMKQDNSIMYKETFFKGAIPYYENLPVSAGQIAMVEGEEQPTGYVKIPGVSASWLFPVVRCSMKPEINPGDIVGVNAVDRWDRVDPDKIYMIVTNEERMIKRLRIDNENDEILWCISPNYPEFKILKSEVKVIYQVVFHGELM